MIYFILLFMVFFFGLSFIRLVWESREELDNAPNTHKCIEYILVSVIVFSVSSIFGALLYSGISV